MNWDSHIAFEMPAYDDVLRPFRKVAKVSETHTTNGEPDSLISRQTVLYIYDEGTKSQVKKTGSKDMKKKAELSLKYSVYMHANKLLMHR